MKNRLGFKYFFSLIVLFAVILPVSGEFSVREKLDNRSFPSIFAAWSEWFVNRPELTNAEMTAYHDLFWSPDTIFGILYDVVDGKVVFTGDVGYADYAREKHAELMHLNPSMLLLLQVDMRGTAPTSPFLAGLYGKDFPFIRSQTGEIVLGTPAEYYEDLLIDFTHPKAQEIIIGQAVAVAESGLWDGIFIDFWDENGVVLNGHRTYEAEQAARLEILRGIRERVREDFLIIVNNTGKLISVSAPYINGLFMETFRENFSDYQHDGLMRLEEILLWASDNLRHPQVTCFEAEGIGSQLPMSSDNLQSMRCLTTLNLTHSNGFFVYTLGVQWDEVHPHSETYLNYEGAAFQNNPPYWIRHRSAHKTFLHLHHHEHYWYDFWDADLGQPVGEKGQRYEDIEGLFIREFTNGWAVYNRSGKEQVVKLPVKSSGVESRITAIEHTIPDLDGEIFLKAPVVIADLNGDEVVNVLDLVIVAEAFGVENPSHADVNGDGTVNILDLVSVAQEMQ